MVGGKKGEKDSISWALVEMQSRLKSVFEKVPNEISLYLFTSPDKNDLFGQGARQIIRALREFSPKATGRDGTARLL